MLIIKNEFQATDGTIYDNVRNIHYEKKEDLFGNVGTFIAESSKQDSKDFEISEEGVYVYRSFYDKSKGLRIYKDYGSYQYTHYDDYKLISKLQKKQKDIKLSEFPTGVVTIENKVIGQEMPFYENSDPIGAYFNSGKMQKRPTHFYLEVLKILKELYKEGIVYTDVHTKNFLINNITEVVNIIDFEEPFVHVDNASPHQYLIMIENLKLYLLDKLNAMVGVKFDNSYEKADTLEEIEEVVKECDHKLKIK
ncbi:MAG: hypothetical protein IKL65_01220 [Bacilli bacterium]|nr:hypothetical protein [Bacilli bacterium]